jgi:hypothetical protein
MKRFFTVLLVLAFGLVAREAGAGTFLEKGRLAEMFVLDRLFSEERLLGEGQTRLGDLLLLDSAFENIEAKKDSLPLGDLFVLDVLFSKNSAILDQDRTSLGDLLILDQLFSGSKIFTENKSHQELGLGELFLLDRLFSNSGQELLSIETTSLGDILILLQLFD